MQTAFIPDFVQCESPAWSLNASLNFFNKALRLDFLAYVSRNANSDSEMNKINMVQYIYNIVYIDISAPPRSGGL